MADPSDVVSGMVIRGADGKLYFITKEQLKKIQIPEDRTDGIKDAIERGGTNEIAIDERGKRVWNVRGPLGLIVGESWEYWL
jgi:hypothetical protein